MKNSDQPINPVPHQNDDGSIQHDVYTGLTKREYFAAKAMQGLLSNPQIKRPHPENGDMEKQYTEFSNIAVEYADALLAELEKTNKP